VYQTEFKIVYAILDQNFSQKSIFSSKSRTLVKNPSFGLNRNFDQKINKEEGGSMDLQILVAIRTYKTFRIFRMVKFWSKN